MNIIKRLLPVCLATFIILVSAAVVFTSADEPDSSKLQHRETVQSALESGDYSAWAAAISEGDREPKILEYINVDNFGQFVEMHNLRQRANAIAEELGLPKRKMGKIGKRGFKNHGQQKPELTDEQKEIMQQVIELKKAGDFEGAKALFEESGIEWGPKFHKGFKKGQGKKRGFFQPQN